MEFEGDDALAFVISHNLHRRHLSESQRARIAARVADMPRGGVGSNQHQSKSANWQNSTSISDAANLLNVSERSVARARKVQETAPPEIVQAVDDGNISVSLAAKVADLPDDLARDANWHVSPVTRAEAASLLNVSERFLAHLLGHANHPGGRVGSLGYLGLGVVRLLARFIIL